MEVSTGYPPIAFLPAGKPFKGFSKTQELSALSTAFPVSFLFFNWQKCLSYLSSRYTTWYHSYTFLLWQVTFSWYTVISSLIHACSASLRSLLGRGVLFDSVVRTWDFTMISPPFRRKSALMNHLSIFCIPSTQLHFLYPKSCCGLFLCLRQIHWIHIKRKPCPILKKKIGEGNGCALNDTGGL